VTANSSIAVWPETGPFVTPSNRVLTGPGTPGIPARFANLAPGNYFAVVWTTAPPGQWARDPDFLARFNALAARVTVEPGVLATVTPAIISAEAMQKVLAELPR
jgi:hypothetical protein